MRALQIRKEEDILILTYLECMLCYFQFEYERVTFKSITVEYFYDKACPRCFNSQLLYVIKLIEPDIVNEKQ